MNRRRILQAVAALPLVPDSWPRWPRPRRPPRPGLLFSRPTRRPGLAVGGELGRLNRDVGGRLITVESPLAACIEDPESATCTQVFDALKNPYYLGDEVGLTQTLGWVDGWTSRPSVYAVAARTTDDVVAAVNFARENNLRLVVKGGGHSYQGTSNAADSLLIWTRHMNAITVHDAFVGTGCEGQSEPQPAVTVDAGAIWGQVYDAVTTQAGRYVQGGGCLTVGVAGLIQSGGFSSFSKAYGMAAASLLEAEIVTADGAGGSPMPARIRTCSGRSRGRRRELRHRDQAHAANARPAGILRCGVHDHPGGIGRRVSAADWPGHRLLRRGAVQPHWGEQIAFRPGNVLDIAMVFQGLDQEQAEVTWRPFFDWLAASPQDFTIASGPSVLAAPAQSFWDPQFLAQVPGLILADDRPGAPETNVFYASNLEEAGQVLHGYQSAWLPASLLEENRQQSLVEALFAATRHWSVSLHTNKGLAGGPAEAIAAARQTATNPAVLDAFALIICAAEGPPAYPGLPGHEPDLTTARNNAEAIDKAMHEVRTLLPSIGSYLAESDFFAAAWRDAFWGPNYAKLLAVKDKYDPDGLFVVHHGVGSERWSADGFARLDGR